MPLILICTYSMFYLKENSLFWLIIYQKNSVSATINLPLFQLAKNERMSFWIMQNDKIFGMSSTFELLLINLEVNESWVVYSSNRLKYLLQKCISIRLLLHRSKLWHFPFSWRNLAKQNKYLLYGFIIKFDFIVM